jgi:hypothetical protein
MHFVNLLIWYQMQSAVGRVDLSTLDAAITGTHQDRRLYYERVGKLKQKEVGTGGGTIVFLNDAIKRPDQLQVIPIRSEASSVASPDSKESF